MATKETKLIPISKELRRAIMALIYRVGFYHPAMMGTGYEDQAKASRPKPATRED